MRTF